MNTFEILEQKLKDKNIPHEIRKVDADSIDVDAHVKALGIKYKEGMSTLLFKVKNKDFVAILRRDDKNIDSKALKKFLGTGDFTFCNEEDLAKFGFKPGLASPLLLEEARNKLKTDNSKLITLVDKAILEMSRIICGSTDPHHAIEIQKSDLLKNIGEYEVVEVTVPNPKRQDSGSQVSDIRHLGGKPVILTGDRPTGKLHIGHLMGSLLNRVKLQDEYNQHIMIANIQALTDNFDNPGKVKESIQELLCDYYAVGIDFDKSTVFIQSEVPEIHEIFIYLANFATIQQLSHNPTLKTEIEQKRYGDSTPLGFFIYPVHQAADILCVNADLVPVGKDQAPMVEDCRELARKFNSTYNANVLSQPKGLFGVEKNIPGVDGNEKMGKSLNNAIYLSDSEEELRRKVFAVKTDPNRIHATDPGTVEGNIVFIYHDLFNDNKEEVEDLKERYRKGTVGDVEVKEKLFIAMNNFLKPIRDRRKEAEEMKDALLNKAIEGSKKVRTTSRKIADEMKKAMQIEF